MPLWQGTLLLWNLFTLSVSLFLNIHKLSNWYCNGKKKTISSKRLIIVYPYNEAEESLIKIICMVTFWSCIKYILIKYKSQSKLKKRHHIIPNFPNNFRKSEITYILTIIISPPNFLHYNFHNIHKILIVWLQYGADSCSMQHYWKPIFDDDSIIYHTLVSTSITHCFINMVFSSSLPT